MLDFLMILVVVACVAFLVYLALWAVPIHWYIAWFLARYDFVFTNVPEGYFKVVVRFGAIRRIIMSKENHRVDESGDIVELIPGEQPESVLPGGLRLVGWPGIDRIYTREMRFLKALPNGDIKPYEVEGVDTFYAKVDYPYALPFVKCEDKNNLPLDGHATLLAHVANPAKSLYLTANFYDTMVGLVLPSVRECLKGYSFDELKEKDDLDEIIWEKLEELNPSANSPQGKISVIDELRDSYGVSIVALRIVNIDPPEEYRKATLTKWMAERKKDAAVAVADEEYERVFGPIQRAKAAGLNEKSSVELRSQSLAGPNFAYTKSKIDITSADEKIDPNIAGLIGGAKAIFGGGGGGKQTPPSANPGAGNPTGGGSGQGNVKDADVI
ncbi:MAG: SPFH domain-containing protein [bacterium]